MGLEVRPVRPTTGRLIDKPNVAGASEDTTEPEGAEGHRPIDYAASSDTWSPEDRWGGTAGAVMAGGCTSVVLWSLESIHSTACWISPVMLQCLSFPAKTTLESILIHCSKEIRYFMSPSVRR
jgi:hypothetical protein